MKKINLFSLALFAPLRETSSFVLFVSFVVNVFFTFGYAVARQASAVK